MRMKNCLAINRALVAKKRIFAFLAMVLFGFAAMTAQVTTNLEAIYNDYTGTLVLTFNPSEGNAGMVQALECYSHIGLITENSADHDDWKYIKNDGEWGQPTEPKWTRVGSMWQLEIDNFREWFGCPTTEQIDFITMVFHDGKGLDSKQGKTDTDGNIEIPVLPAPNCFYTIQMWDNYGDYWNGNAAIHVVDGTFEKDYSIYSGIGSMNVKTVQVPAYGNNPTFTWIPGTWDEECGFAIFDKNGNTLLRHECGDAFPDPLLAMSNSPCDAAANSYAVENLNTEVSADEVYAWWDENTNVYSWLVELYNPDGKIIANADVYQSDLLHAHTFTGLKEAKVSGEFKVVVTPRNASSIPLCQPTEAAFEYKHPGLGDLEVSVFIPSDSKFDFSQGIQVMWFNTEIGKYVEGPELERDGETRWWKAKVTVTSPTTRIAIQTPVIGDKYNWAYSPTIEYNTPICLEVGGLFGAYDEYDEYELYDATCFELDHNWVVESVYPAPAYGYVSLGIMTYDGVAPSYRVNLYTDDPKTLWGSFDVTSWPFEISDIQNPDPIEVTGWTIQAQDMYDRPVGDLVEFPGFTILTDEGCPQGLEASVEDASRICTFRWIEVPGAASYYMEVIDAEGNYVYNTTELASSLSIVDDKFQVSTTNGFHVNGKATLRIIAKDNFDNNMGANTLEFEVNAPLNGSALHIQVPSDCSMDISGGVYVMYQTPTNPDFWIIVQAIAEGANPSWYEAGFSVDADSYDFFVVNKLISDPAELLTAQVSKLVEGVATQNAWYSLWYNAGADEWPIENMGHYEPDHDYTLTAIDIDATSDPGSIIVANPTFVSTTPSYLGVLARPKGFPVDFDTLGYYSAYSLPETQPLLLNADADFEYVVFPAEWIDADKYRQVAAGITGDVTILANPCVLHNMKAEVAEDGATVTFSWDENTNVDSWTLTALDEEDNYLFSASGTTEHSVETQIFATTKVKWCVEVSNGGYYKGTMNGPEFELTKPDVMPKNARLDWIDDRTVIISWDVPAVVARCELRLMSEGLGFVADAYLTAKDGHYSFIYAFEDDVFDNFEWQVIPMDEYYTWLLPDPVSIASFAIPGVKFTLQITAGTGGTVNESVNGEYYAGQIVHIAASADMDFQFDQWSDGNTDAERDILINNDIVLEAQFSATSHTLTIAAGLGGSVNDVVNGPHPVGEIVHIIATPDEGCQFVEWSDGDTNAERDITMDADINLTASFEIIQYELTISATTGGSVNETVNGKYNIGTKVEIVATPESDYDFIQWSDGDKNATREITMDADKTLQAIFAEKGAKYQLTLATSEGGSVNTEVNGEYESGAEVHIVATPAEGYLFDQWSDGDKNAERDIIMISDLTLSASFKLAPKMYTLTIAAGEGGIVNAEVNGSYEEGTDVVIKATPGADYYFNFWSDGDGSATRTITMDEDKSLIAVFAPNVYKYTLTVTASEGGEVNDVSGVYEALEAVNLVATPASGYTFLKWSDGFISSNRTVYMSEDITLEAIFVPSSTKFTITISAEGPGTVNDAINGEYEAGTGVLIEATPDLGNKLLQWSDGNKDATRTIFLTQDTTLMATFVDATLQYTLTISAGANGSVNETVNGDYDAGNDVTIIATPDAGYVFDEWSDHDKNATRVVRMTDNITLEASFKVAPTMYFLTIAAGANGSVNSEVIGAYEEGESVHIVATPDAGYVFDKWTDGDTNAERDIVMDAEKTLIATFKLAPVQFTLTISAGEHGSVNTEVNGLHDEGEIVHIVATPAEGYEFDEWSDHDKNAERDITIDADITLTASFKEKSVVTQYTLTISAGEHGSVNETVNGKYDAGSSVNIIATADEGYVFDKWSDGNTEANRTIVISSDTTLAASFKEKAVGVQYTLTISAGEHGSVNTAVNGKYDEGTNVTIIATADAGYHFDKWSDGNTNATRVVTMNADITLTASFLSDTKYTVKITVVKGEDADELYGKIKVNDGSEKTKYEDEVYGGTKLTVEAVPEEGYTLDEWSDDEDEKALVREIEITSDTTIKVTFRQLKKVTLTVDINPAKAGKVLLNGEVREDNQLKVTEGKSITVKAVPNEGYKFKGWEDANGEIFETAAETSIKMTKSRTITAVFEASQGFENVEVENAQAQKMIINGQLFILRDGKIFNASGVLVK